MIRSIIIFILILISSSAYAGDTTTNGYFYLPALGESYTTNNQIRNQWWSRLQSTDSILGLMRSANYWTNGANSTLTGDTDLASANLAVTGAWSFAAGKFLLPKGTTLPTSDCDNADEAGRIFIKTNATSGQQLYVCEGTTGWGVLSSGSGGGVVDAADITYDNEDYPTVESALNSLLYDAPTIITFINNQNSVENGSTITSTQLDWTISGTITSQSINQSVGSLATGLRTTTHSSSYSTNRTYTLTISDGTTTTQKSTSITFLNSNYYGASANTSLNSSQVNALSHALASSRTQTRTITATAQYIYIAYPAAYGAATFTVNGLTNNDWTLSTQSHTNASGATVSYNVYRTNNLLTGTYTIEVN